MNRNTGRQYTATSLRNGGRRAGMGMAYDDYSEESGRDGTCYGTVKVRFPHDGVNPEELNGECIIVQKGKVKNDGK